MVTFRVAAIRAAVPLVTRAVVRVANNLVNRAAVRVALGLVFPATVASGVFERRGVRRGYARGVALDESFRKLADPRAERVVFGADPLVVLLMRLFSRRRRCCLRLRLSCRADDRRFGDVETAEQLPVLALPACSCLGRRALASARVFCRSFRSVRSIDLCLQGLG